MAHKIPSSSKSEKNSKKIKINVEPDEENKYYQMIELLYSLKSEYNYLLDPPVILMIGDQNVGKSMFINRFINIDAMPSRKKTDNGLQNNAKTIFPIVFSTRPNKKYHIKYDMLKNNISILTKREEGTFDTKEELLDKISSHIDCHVKENSKNNYHDEIYIKLDISGPDLTFAHFVDLPGIINNDAFVKDRISYYIKKSITDNKNAIYLFVTNAAADQGSTAAWEHINNVADKNNVIWLITNVDRLALEDRKLVGILKGDTKYGIPPNNIFLIRNQDTMSGDDKIYSDNDEAVWFNTHSLYSSLPYQNQYGVVCAKKFILGRLKTTLDKQIPEISILFQKKLNDCYVKRNKLGQIKNFDTLDSKKSEFYYLTKDFIDSLNNIFYRESQCDLVYQIKEILKSGFRKDIHQIKFDNGITKEEIHKKLDKSGGLNTAVMGHDERILTDIIFDRDNSPFSLLLQKIQLYVDLIYQEICNIILNLVVPDTNIDDVFWKKLKQLTIDSFDKNKTINEIMSFCKYQRFNFDSYIQNDDNKNINTTIDLSKIYKIDPINTMDMFWKRILSNISMNFPKFINGSLIHNNINGLKELFRENEESLIGLISENKDSEDQRRRLDNEIKKLESFLAMIKSK